MLVRRIAGQAGEVTKAWEGETVICIASGPSLTKENLEMTRGRKVIAVNDNYLVAPWAQVCYFADAKWWKWHKEGIAKSWPWVSFTAAQVKEAFAGFAGQKVSIEHKPQPSDEDVLVLKNDGPDGLSENPQAIRTGSNSGYQALNIAVLAGAKRIVLLGYDMYYEGAKSHAHNGHPDKMSESAYRGYATLFKTLQVPLKKLGVEVLNCSEKSRIDCFTKVSLEKALCGPTA